MKYTLRSKYSNVIQHTDSERKRDRLLDLGYTLVEDKAESELNLDKMTVDQLEAFAKEKEISLEGCGNKAEKLAKIKEAIAN